MATENPNAGYHDCPCRDCFEIAIGAEVNGGPSLCNECEEAGCDITGDSECEAPDPDACSCTRGTIGHDDPNCEGPVRRGHRGERFGGE